MEKEIISGNKTSKLTNLKAPENEESDSCDNNRYDSITSYD